MWEITKNPRQDIQCSNRGLKLKHSTATDSLVYSPTPFKCRF